MLVENSLKNDLQSQNQYICGLACCSIGNISSAEICRDLSPEVEKLMVGSNPFVAKKAALCSIRILRKCPELVDNFVERVGTLLGSRNHAVLLTALKLMREICETEPPMVEQVRWARAPTPPRARGGALAPPHAAPPHPPPPPPARRPHPPATHPSSSPPSHPSCGGTRRR